jgi:hypothetical protein
MKRGLQELAAAAGGGGCVGGAVSVAAPELQTAEQGLRGGGQLLKSVSDRQTEKRKVGGKALNLLTSPGVRWGAAHHGRG